MKPRRLRTVHEKASRYVDHAKIKDSSFCLSRARRQLWSLGVFSDETMRKNQTDKIKESDSASKHYYYYFFLSVRSKLTFILA